jgi:LemA protein
MIFSYSPKPGFTVVNEAEISTPPKVDFGGAGQSPGKQ